MSMQEQKTIFANNLRRLMAERHLAQIEVADAIGVPPQTFNNWCMGQTLPRMNKVQALAEYMGTTMSALIDPPGTGQTTIEDLLRVRPDLDELLDVARKLSPADVQALISIARRFSAGK